MENLRTNKNMPEADFEAWIGTQEQRYELIEGEITNFASPSPAHQYVSDRISAQFLHYFKGKDCISLSTINVVLQKEGEDNQWVIPDISVICPKFDLSQTKYQGIPKLIVEILSPSNQSHDLITKMNIYAKYGVPEYWIVNPLNKSLSIYTLDESGHYIQDIVEKTGNVKSKFFSGLAVDLDGLFQY